MSLDFTLGRSTPFRMQIPFMAPSNMLPMGMPLTGGQSQGQNPFSSLADSFGSSGGDMSNDPFVLLAKLASGGNDPAKQLNNMMQMAQMIGQFMQFFQQMQGLMQQGGLGNMLGGNQGLGNNSGSTPGVGNDLGSMGNRQFENIRRADTTTNTGNTTGPGDQAVGGPVSRNLAANQREAYAAARAGDPSRGIPGLSDTAARALVANMTAESLSNPRDHHWDVKHMSQGIVQWDPNRAAAIKREFGKFPKDMTVAEQTKAALWEMRNKYPRTWNALQGGNPNQMMDMLVRDYERPANPGQQVTKRLGIFNRLGNLGN
jgi:hypothetical protein